ncbi:MAG TPA: M14 family zinc carboxypeptidase [Pyrinomonadaceae bacterium]|nr:M14 family zinc carboxypeptidase [Pyrinomonadaceae bacterium]
MIKLLTATVLGLACFLITPNLIRAQTVNSYAPDTPEPGSIEAIAGFTTEKRFSNPWVSYVPASNTVTSPTKYLGHVAGAAGELSNTAKVFGYLRELDRTSPRVQIETIGRSEEGRDILLLAVADEEGLRDLARLKAATAALADPRKTTPEAAEKIISAARPIYYFNAGLHSTETGSPEMVMELAYRLAVSEQPMIERIRRNLIVLINPVSEPDGRDKAVDWFYRHLKGKTDYENLPPDSPPYWGHYVFHDNNRDTHQKALQLTRAVHRMFYDYHPTVMHDLHESIPLLQTWNGTGPFNGNLDPILVSEFFEMSFSEISTMSAMGMPGVWTWGFGEGWGHHYLESVAVNHNSIGRGYETFGNTTAETVERVLRPSDERYVERPVTSREWYRPFPPDRRFLWSLRNNTNYMQTGCLAILDYAARNAPNLLRNFYRKGYNSWQKGAAGNPFAYAVRAEQGDRRRVAQMLNVLMGHRVEVSRAAAAFRAAGEAFPAGTYLVRLDQPYRNYAVDLLEPQRFPADAQYEPYDDVSWALPVHYGVEAKRIDDEQIKNVPAELITAELRPVGRVAGRGPVYLLKDTGQESLLALRHRLASFKVEIAEKSFTVNGENYPAGSWVITGQDNVRDALEKVAAELAIDFESANAAPDVPRHASPLPRLAVWHLWNDSQAVGWIRHTLDAQKIAYEYIRDEDIRAGRLRNRFDIILYGHTFRSLQDQIQGIDRKYGPLAYTRTAQYPSHGVPDASNDITGGIGWAGVANLEKFTDEGGLLITLGNGSALALDGGLVRGVSRASAGGLFTPGVELKVKFKRPDHPLAYGYPEVTSAFRSAYPVYQVRVSDGSRVVLQWGTKAVKDDREDSPAEKENIPMLISGVVRGEDDLEGRPAILDIPAAKGRVLAYNFNPLHRDLNHSDYRFLWNALLNWNALPPAGN